MFCEKYRATNKTSKLYQTWKLCHRTLVLVVSKHVPSYLPSICKWSWTQSRNNAGLGWSYWYLLSVHVGRWRKRANKEGAMVQLWWLTTCTLYTSFTEWSCSLLKQTRIVLRTALWINCCKSEIWNHWQALKVLNNLVAGYACKTPVDRATILWSTAFSDSKKTHGPQELVKSTPSTGCRFSPR